MHVLLESREDKSIGEKEKVYALRIHEILFAVEIGDELAGTKNIIGTLDSGRCTSF